MMPAMPRVARACPPGSIQHIIPRLVNREFRLTGETERADYLDRDARARASSDWRPLSYALMSSSSHIHIAAVAGAGTAEPHRTHPVGP